jgi:hypothetical protein
MYYLKWHVSKDSFQPSCVIVVGNLSLTSAILFGGKDNKSSRRSSHASIKSAVNGKQAEFFADVCYRDIGRYSGNALCTRGLER